MSQSKRLFIVLLLNVVMIAGLVIIGLSSHSIGVLAAGGDYTADSVAIVLGLIAIRLREKKHGNTHATTYVAAINASLLVIITAFVMIESVHRLTGHAPVIQGLHAMMISILAALVMLVGAVIITGDKADKDLHMRSVLLDTVSDGVSSVAVAITGGVIYFTKNYYWLDSLAALIIGLIIGFTALKLLRDVATELRRKNT